MVGIKRYEYETGILSFRIRKDVKESNTTQAILQDLWAIFRILGSKWYKPDLEQILKDHPLGNAIIEVLPE